MQTRADKYTQINKIPVRYTDFTNSFTVHPLTNVLAMTTNQNAVAQAIKNLIKTNLGERPFELDVGTNTTASLFEQNDFIASDTLTTNIAYAINTFEKRAHLLNVTVVPDDSSLIVNVVFSILNNPQPVSIQVVLERVR